MSMRWEVIYKDGSTVAEGQVPYGELNRENLAYCCIYLDDVPRLIVHLDDDKRLIVRRRVAKGLDGREMVAYICGWQKTVDGRNIQSISIIYETGIIEVADRFKEHHPWLYAVNFMPEEVN